MIGDQLVRFAVKDQDRRFDFGDGADGVGVVGIEAGDFAAFVDGAEEIVVAEEPHLLSQHKRGRIEGGVAHVGEGFERDAIAVTRGSISAHWSATAPP